MELVISEFCSADNPVVSSLFYIPEWQVLAVLAFAVSAVLLASIYAVSRLFGNEQVEGWVKIEVFELLSTAFIVVVLVGLFSAACRVPVDSLGISPPDELKGLNVFDAASQALSEFSRILAYTMTGLHLFYIPFDFMTTQTMTAHPLGMGTVIQPTAGMGAVIKPGYVNALQMMTVAFIITRAQLLLLDFSTYAMLKFYLPLGILLRCFTPTRRIGGTLIGLAVGLVLVFPSLIVLNGVFVLSFFSALNPLGMNESFEFLGSIMGGGVTLMPVVTEFWDTLTGSFGSVSPFSLFRLPIAVVSSFIGVFASFYFFLFMWAAGQAFLIGLFFPALNTLLLVTTIRYLSRAFGEEIDVTNLTRMI